MLKVISRSWQVTAGEPISIKECLNRAKEGYGAEVGKAPGSCREDGGVRGGAADLAAIGLCFFMRDK